MKTQMNLIETLLYLQNVVKPSAETPADARKKMWEVLEQMGIDYSVQTAIMNSIDGAGEFIDKYGQHYRLLDFYEVRNEPQIHAVKRIVPEDRISEQ